MRIPWIIGVFWLLQARISFGASDIPGMWDGQRHFWPCSDSRARLTAGMCIEFNRGSHASMMPASYRNIDVAGEANFELACRDEEGLLCARSRDEDWEREGHVSVSGTDQHRRRLKPGLGWLSERLLVCGSIWGSREMRMRLRGGSQTDVEPRLKGKRQRLRTLESELDTTEQMDRDTMGQSKAPNEAQSVGDTRMDLGQDNGRSNGMYRPNQTKANSSEASQRHVMDDIRDLSDAIWRTRVARDSLNISLLPPAQKAAFEQTRCAQEVEVVKYVDDLKARMLYLLNWRDRRRAYGTDCMPPQHSRGGFACVLLDPYLGVAFRIEPMRSMVDAAAWLGFHIVLELFGVRAADSVAVDRPSSVLDVDRRMSQHPPYVYWNQTAMVRCYQEPTLAAFSKHVIKHRNKILKAYQHRKGGLLAVTDEYNRTRSMLLTPRAWFWHQANIPIYAEAANGTLTPNDRVRRVRGKELADAFCGQEGGGERNHSGEARSVKLLCTVFDLASTDVATVARTHWKLSAPPDVPIRVLQDIGQALRCMHACGVAHGDVKMANILFLKNGYWLGDLPALTRATTKMLTSDPICSTVLITGKRMLSNDMWGLGLITLALLGGSSTFKNACEKLKTSCPVAHIGSAWFIFSAGFLHALNQLVRDEDVAEVTTSIKGLLNSTTGRRMIRVLNREQRETSRREGEMMAIAVSKNPVTSKILKQLTYCLDVSNIARNALAMLLPKECGL